MPTYPAPPPQINGDEISIHRLLQTPTLIQRRVRTLADQKFISDAILTQRLPAAGGAVWFEQGEPLGADRDPEPVSPGAEYSQTSISDGQTQLAAVAKWGEDTIVTDEAIKRQLRSPVDRGFAKLVNQMVRHVDSISLATVWSQVTQTAQAAAAWTTAGTKASAIFLDVAKAQATITGLGEGFAPDTVVVNDMVYASVIASFVDAGLTPRESADTPALTGEFPVVAGMRWLPSPHVPTSTGALVLDSMQLGGMGDEDLGGPGYIGGLAGIETKVIRDDDRDRYKLRARRVTVPVVLEPSAAVLIQGVAA